MAGKNAADDYPEVGHRIVLVAGRYERASVRNVGGTLVLRPTATEEAALLNQGNAEFQTNPYYGTIVPKP